MARWDNGCLDDSHFKMSFNNQGHVLITMEVSYSLHWCKTKCFTIMSSISMYMLFNHILYLVHIF